MQIKKFIAPTLKEATNKMKEALGNDSIILSTRIIESDTAAGFGKMFELTAGVEDDMGLIPSTNQLQLTESNNNTKNFSDELNRLTNKIYVQKNFNDLTSHNKNIIQNKHFSFEQELNEINQLLELREIQKPLINSIIDYLKENKSLIKTAEDVDNNTVASIASMIPTSEFELIKRNNPKVVAFVGPTGVGKTTCIAKLALISKILHNLNVGLISIDTYRLGAIDQLRIFSEVSNIDLLVAYEPEEMPRLIKSFKDKDIIFIDTAGRSQKNTESLTETKNFLSTIKLDEIFLVLSATNTTKNLFDAAERFKPFNYHSFIFTKLDEAVAFGNLLNVTTNFAIPVSFLANGQVIPDDIIASNSDFIAKMIYTGKISK